MKKRQILVGSFDLFHLGHVDLIEEVRQRDTDVIIGVLSDDAVMALWGTSPFVPDHERAEIVERLRSVDSAFITGPEQNWFVPEHDELFIDDLFHAGFQGIRKDLVASAIGVKPHLLPAHPALQRALTEPLPPAIVA